MHPTLSQVFLAVFLLATANVDATASKQRTLLQSGNAADCGNPISTVGGNDNFYKNLGLRIAAVFIILGAGLAGTLPALFYPPCRDTTSVTSRFLRSMAAGTIITLALLHINPVASTLLGYVVPGYDVGACLVIFGFLFMVLLESIAHLVAHNRDLEHAAEVASDKHRTGSDLEDAIKQNDQQDMNVKKMEEPTKEEIRASGEVPKAACAHSSQIITGNFSSNTAKVTAYVMEAGCIIHSVLIGIMMGMETDTAQLTVLIIAIAFHQILEGLALGTVLATANFAAKWKAPFMALCYSSTTPMGIAIGIGVMSDYNPCDTATLVAQGVINGVSGGMVLYIGAVQLIAKDFAVTDGRSMMMHLTMCGALLLGTASMCVVGIWA